MSLFVDSAVQKKKRVRKSKNQLNSANPLNETKTSGSSSISSSSSIPCSVPPGCYKIFVGNLPYSVRSIDLRSLFTCCGNIWDIRISTYPGTNKCRGFCHIEFENEQQVANALKLDGILFSRADEKAIEQEKKRIQKMNKKKKQQNLEEQENEMNMTEEEEIERFLTVSLAAPKGFSSDKEQTEEQEKEKNKSKRIKLESTV